MRLEATAKFGNVADIEMTNCLSQFIIILASFPSHVAWEWGYVPTGDVEPHNQTVT